jgi:beta-lactam-binding protein with PASTA domain
MPKRIRIRRRILQVVVCAAVNLCVVPPAMITAAQCLTIEGPKEVPVPPLERLMAEAARGALQKVGLKLGSVNPSDGKGIVFRQSLEPNRCVPIGSAVNIWLENPTPPPATTVEVPNLRGKSP